MEKLNAIFAFIGNLIKKIKFQMIFGMFLIICSVLLFVPNNYLDYIGLSYIDSTYKTMAGIGFVFSVAYFMCLILEKAKSVFHKYHLRNSMYNYLKKEASDEERGILYEYFYNKKENKFNLTGVIPCNTGTHHPMVAHMIIYQSSHLSRGDIYFPYNFQPFICKRLNNDLQKGKVYIKDGIVCFK